MIRLKLDAELSGHFSTNFVVSKYLVAEVSGSPVHVVSRCFECARYDPTRLYPAKMDPAKMEERYEKLSILSYSQGCTFVHSTTTEWNHVTHQFSDAFSPSLMYD